MSHDASNKRHHPEEKSFVSLRSKQLLWLLLTFNNISAIFHLAHVYRLCLLDGEVNLETSLFCIRPLPVGTQRHAFVSVIRL